MVYSEHNKPPWLTENDLDPSLPFNDSASSQIVFFLNNERAPRFITSDSSSEWGITIADYIRGRKVGLMGTKIGCEEGGCGACTVVVGKWDNVNKKPK